MAKRFSSSEIEALISEFGINTDVEQVVVRADAELYRIKGKEYSCFIIDSPEAMQIACRPSLVGDDMENLSGVLAAKALPAILEAGEIKNQIIFEHILRASLGYHLYDSLVNEREIAQVWIRTQYTYPSYKDHSELEKRIVSTFEDFSALDSVRGEADLVVQDTIASGKTLEFSLKRILEEAENRGIQIRNLVLYGFMSEKGLDYIWDEIKNTGIKLHAFAISDLTPLCSNNYDMPLYGPDESLYSEKGIIKNIGGVISKMAFQRYAELFIPGLDQPGDFSARLSKLYNGKYFEESEISVHLKRTYDYLERIEKMLKKERRSLYKRISERIFEEKGALVSKMGMKKE